MAASFTTTSTTLEGQLLEIARELQELELGIPEEQRPNNVTITPDLEGLTVSITATLPIAFSGTGAAITLTAAPYIGI